MFLGAEVAGIEYETTVEFKLCRVPEVARFFVARHRKEELVGVYKYVNNSPCSHSLSQHRF